MDFVIELAGRERVPPGGLDGSNRYIGQEPLGPGVTQVGSVSGMLGMVQHNWPAAQQRRPQQSVPGHIVPARHGGVPHMPLSQYGFGSGHRVPHAPQFLMSF